MTGHPYGRRKSESQRGVERIYVLTLFPLTSSFFVPAATSSTSSGMPGKPSSVSVVTAQVDHRLATIMPSSSWPTAEDLPFNKSCAAFTAMLSQTCLIRISVRALSRTGKEEDSRRRSLVSRVFYVRASTPGIERKRPWRYALAITGATPSSAPLGPMSFRVLAATILSSVLLAMTGSLAVWAMIGWMAATATIGWRQ